MSSVLIDDLPGLREMAEAMLTDPAGTDLITVRVRRTGVSPSGDGASDGRGGAVRSLPATTEDDEGFTDGNSYPYRIRRTATNSGQSDGVARRQAEFPVMVDLPVGAVVSEGDWLTVDMTDETLEVLKVSDNTDALLLHLGCKNVTARIP